ncbi:unnamed protein product [Adineta ricciae]|uniref:RING-type domain-containing protein n=1 Tax=Adineta ricciae TaxID=249248 RepID=A0A815YHU2_ADIRI|nr:unnamed protein product [Adineta ricciae]
MQKSSSLFRPNTFRDSNETTAKHDLVEPSAPVEERMESNSPPRLSMVCPMEMDEQSSHRITNRFVMEEGKKHRYRSASAIKQGFDQLQRVFKSDEIKQFFPLTKSIFRANNRNDSDEANQEQTGREEMSHNDNIALEASGYDQSRLADLSADEAFALQLQQEEYSRDSLATARHPFFPFRVASDDESATASAPPYVVVDEHPSFPNDDELALYVHRQEQATRQRHYPYPRTLFGPRQRSNEHSQSGENDNEPVVPSPYPTFSFRNHSHNEDDSDEEDGYPNMRHPLFQYLLQQNGPLPEDFPAFLAGFPRQRRRRSGNLQDTEEDFGPEDYERLLRLDETVHKKKLTKEQINSIPIESFHRTSNTNTDEENKCGVCLDLFETNQALRRFPCRHVYHKECADRWLQENNVCPICREPPVKVQSATNSRHHRTMNSTHHHNQNRDNRRPTHTNRNPAPRPNTNFDIMSTNNQPDSSLSNEQIVANNNPITTNQTLSEDQVPTSGEVLEIDDALADQSDSWETDDEGDFYTEPTTGRLSDQDDDDNLLSLGLSKHLIECYPMSTAEEASIVGVVCDICLNEYKTHDKVRTIPCLHRFHTRCIDKWLKKSSKCPMCRSDLRKPKWYKS